MKLNPETRTRIMADMVLDTDPAGSAVEVKVDDTWYDAAWLTEGATRVVAVNGVMVTRWYRTARTTGHFCGPDATALGATVLALGRHPTKTRVSFGSLALDQLVAQSDPIDVK